MEGLWGLGEDGRSRDVYIEGVLEVMMVVVSDYSVCCFWGDCCVLSTESRGFNWRGDMGSPKKSENTDIFSNDKHS